MAAPTSEAPGSGFTYNIIDEGQATQNVQVMWHGAEVGRLPVENPKFAKLRTGFSKLKANNNGTLLQVRVKKQDIQEIQRKVTTVLDNIDRTKEDLNALANVALSIKLFNPDTATTNELEAAAQSTKRTLALNENNRKLDSILEKQTGINLELLNTPLENLTDDAIEQIKTLHYFLSSLRNLYAAKAANNEIPISTYNYVQERLDRLLTKAESLLAVKSADFTKADPLRVNILSAVEQIPIKNWSPEVQYASDRATFFTPSLALKFYNFLLLTREMPNLKPLQKEINTMTRTLSAEANEEELNKILETLDAANKKGPNVELPHGAKSFVELYNHYKDKTGIIDYTFTNPTNSCAYVSDCVGHGDIKKQEQHDKEYSAFNNELEELISTPTQDLKEFKEKLAALVKKYENTPGIAYAAWSLAKIVTLNDGQRIALLLNLGDSASIVLRKTGDVEFVMSPKNNCLNNPQGSIDEFYQAVPLEKGDKLLLVTDGILDFLTKKQIASIFASPPPAGKSRLEQLRTRMEENTKKIEGGDESFAKEGVKAFIPTEISKSDDISFVEMEINH